jgi:hypothetical protein
VLEAVSSRDSGSKYVSKPRHGKGRKFLLLNNVAKKIYQVSQAITIMPSNNIQETFWRSGLGLILVGGWFVA